MRNLNENHESRELKAVSIVIAMLALPIYGSAVAFDGWDARVVSIYVGSVMLVIAAGVRLFAGKPSLFGSAGTADQLRTHYHQPATAAVEGRPATTRDPRAKVWTRSYAAHVARQTIATVVVLAVYISVTVAVTMFLSQAGGTIMFIAAASILAVFFLIGRSFVVSGSAAEPALHGIDPTGHHVPLRQVPVPVHTDHGHAA